MFARVARRKPRRGEALAKELAGKVFGRLTVRRLVRVTSNGKSRRDAECICECGTVKNILVGELEAGRTRSCGCLRSQVTSQRCFKEESGKFGRLTVVRRVGGRFECACECGKSKIVSGYRLRKGITKSCGCYQKCRGREHWNWKPSIAQEDRDNKRGCVKNPKYDAWRRSVYERDEYKCKITGKTGNIVAHHIFAWNKFPEPRYNTNNGITMLASIHNQFHAEYGRGGNTLEQLVEFQSNYNNEHRE